MIKFSAKYLINKKEFFICLKGNKNLLPIGLIFLPNWDVTTFTFPWLDEYNEFLYQFCITDEVPDFNFTSTSQLLIFLPVMTTALIFNLQE